MQKNHNIDGCQSYLERFTWRHHSVLLALSFQPLRNTSPFLFRPGFLNPTIITGGSLCPDLTIKASSSYLYLLDLTVGFE